MPTNTVEVIDLTQLHQILYRYLNSADNKERELVRSMIAICSQELTLSTPQEKRSSVIPFQESDIGKIRTKFYDCLWVCLVMACRSPASNEKECLTLLAQLKSLKTSKIFDIFCKTEWDGWNLLMVGVLNDLDIGRRLLSVIANLEPSQQAQILQQTNVDGRNILCCVLEGESDLLPTLLGVISQIKLHQQAAILLHNGGLLGGNIISFCARFLSLNHPALFKLISKFDYPHRLEVFSQLDDGGYNILKHSIKHMAKQQISLICDSMSTLHWEDTEQIFRESIKLVTLEIEENRTSIARIWDALLLAAFRLDMLPLLLDTICTQTPEFQMQLLKQSDRCRLAVILSLAQQVDPIESLTDILLHVQYFDTLHINSSDDVSKLSPFLRFYCAMLIKIRDLSPSAYGKILSKAPPLLDKVIQRQLNFKSLPVEVNDDGDLMIIEIESNAFNLLHASTGLQNNLTLVLAAIKQNPEAWVYASFDKLSITAVANAATIVDKAKRIEACDAILKRFKRMSGYSMVKSKTKRDYPNAFDFFTRYRLKTVPVREPVFTDEYSPEPKGEESYLTLTLRK